MKLWYKKFKNIGWDKEQGVGKDFTLLKNTYNETNKNVLTDMINVSHKRRGVEAEISFESMLYTYDRDNNMFSTNVLTVLNEEEMNSLVIMIQDELKIKEKK